MNAKKYWLRIFVLLAIIIALGYVTKLMGQAEQSSGTTPLFEVVTEQRDVLAGLESVVVVVENFPPESEKYGFNRQQYTTDVELRLRQYGVKVLTLEKVSQTRIPFLYINVGVLIVDEGRFAAVIISVKLKDLVSLLRKPKLLTVATTWEQSQVLIVGLDRSNEVRDKVRDLVDEFINDYLAANPKVQPPEQKTEKP